MIVQDPHDSKRAASPSRNIDMKYGRKCMMRAPRTMYTMLQTTSRAEALRNTVANPSMPNLRFECQNLPCVKVWPPCVCNTKEIAVRHCVMYVGCFTYTSWSCPASEPHDHFPPKHTDNGWERSRRVCACFGMAKGRLPSAPMPCGPH